jgi:CRISPR system Cascade subunit CasE
MYLSRIELNSRRRDTLRALASPRILHAAVEAGFPRGSDSGRNLWRVDTLSGARYLLVLSRRKPDFTHIVEQYGWPESGQTWESNDYAAFLRDIAKEQVWRFCLCANPVRSVHSDEEEKRGKVCAHVTAEQQKRWLANRSGKNGFSLDGKFAVVERGMKQFDRKGERVTLETATFEGFLTVTDSALLCRALTDGIGRAKAYGCGLMTLARPA